MGMVDHADVVIVGSGITGLAHAYEAHRRGLDVTVVDQDDRPRGASVHSSGHLGVTLQSAAVRDLALATRDVWRSLAEEANVWVDERGSLLCAHTEAQATLIKELAATADSPVNPLSQHEVAEMTGVELPSLVAAAHVPLDLTVDPRQAVPALCAWLEDQGVRFVWRSHVASITPLSDDEAVCIQTSRGPLEAGHVVHCAGADTHRLFSDVAERAAMRRCHSRLLEVRLREPAAPLTALPTMINGTSMLSFPALADTAAAAEVFEEFAERDPEMLGHHVNLTLVPRPAGTFVVGVTHQLETGSEPTDGHSDDDLLRQRSERLLGTGLVPVRSWTHTHLTSDLTELHVAAPHPRVRVVTIGAHLADTTAFGLARTVLDDLG